VALAYLQYKTTDGSDAIFNADIGSNHVYQYKIGDKQLSRDGQDHLGTVSYESALQPVALQNPFNSNFELRIPLAQLNHNNRHVQLCSFRSPKKESPAWSKVCKVWSASITRDTLPAKRIRMMSMETHNSTFSPTRSVTFSVAESRFSTPMFLDQLLNIARLLLPAGSKAISELVGKNTPVAISPDIINKIISGVIQAIEKEDKKAPEKSSEKNNKSQAQSLIDSLNKLSNQSASRTALATPASIHAKARLSQEMDFGLISGPVLAGLISTLGPSLLKAAAPLFQNAPKLLQGVLDSPLKLLQAINQADLEQQKLTEKRIQDMLAQGNQALLTHLLLNNGGSPQAGLPISPATLLNSQSFKRNSQSSSNIDSRVRLRFQWPENNDIGAVYAQNNKLIFKLEPYTELTPPDRPIPEAKVKLSIKQGDKILLEKQYSFHNVMLGQPLKLEIFAHEADKLPLQSELMAVTEFSWKALNGNITIAGNRGLYNFRISGPLFFKSLGSRHHREQALSDIGKYRVFWHRIWEGGSSQHNRWSLEYTARYYYAWDKSGQGNGRMESKLSIDESNSKTTKSKIKWNGMLKSGMEIDPLELLKLLPLFGAAAWSKNEQQVLADEAFAKRINQQATAHLKLRGRDDERGSLWVFPIIDLVDVNFSYVVDTSPEGAVMQIDQQTKTLPIPVSAMFVGAKIEH